LRKNYGGGFVRPEENCRECKSDNDVQWHHIKHLKLDKDLKKLAERKVIALCIECHKKRHHFSFKPKLHK
jgi:hypothetical protein